MRKILIIGGAGFIGINLSKYFLNKKNYVIAIDNFITSTRGNIKELEKTTNYEFIKHDINYPFPKAILTQLFSIDSIYHLACPTGVPNIQKLGEEMLRTCSEGTRNALELAKAHNSDILLASSSEVYGNPKIYPQNESYTGNVDPIGERSPYEEGKRYAEALFKLYERKYKVKAKIVRIFNTYGPNMSESDTRVIPRFIKAIKTGEPLPIHGDGQQSRTFCYIDDLINGMNLVMKKGVDGEVYNLGSDSKITIKKLSLLMKNILRKEININFISRPQHDHNDRLPLLDKINSLGWEQKVSLLDGLNRTFLWYGL